MKNSMYIQGVNSMNTNFLILMHGCYIAGPPPAPSIALNTISETGSPTTRNVTISWTELFFSRISHYVLTVSPPAPPCASGQCLVGAREGKTQITLNTSQRYNFTLRADNCGDVQMGNESEQLTVLLQGIHYSSCW